MKLQNLRVDALSFFPVVTVLLAGGIFVADTITNLEIAFPAFYTVIVMIAARYCTKKGVIYVGVSCMGLTLLSDLITLDRVPSEAGVTNTSISLLAIAATTYLAAKFEEEKETSYETRSQLAHIARVTTLGELTTSIAHQINQPLAAVTINANACLHWLGDEPPNLAEARRNVASIARDVTRASEIITQVRNLTKGHPPERNVLRISELVLSTLTLLDREIQQNQISVGIDLSRDLPPVRGDRVQLQQVILNLILNAIDALTLVPEPDRRLVISSAMNDPKSMIISVEDTGSGFAPEELDRLFQAFYTTKRNGMGMGLAISRSIVEAHGGRMWAKPNSPRGANFHLVLPIGGKLGS
jgi:C4-dicarboxylate-specific signal transduction histidine kinase